MTTRLSIHVFATITFDSKTLHVCKQQQIASGTKVLLVIYNTKTGNDAADDNET